MNNVLEYLIEVDNNLRVLTILDDFLIIATMISTILTIIFVAYITINYHGILRMSTGKTRIIHGMTLILAIVSGILSLTSTYATVKTIRERKKMEDFVENMNSEKKNILENDMIIVEKNSEPILNIKLTESNTYITRNGKTAVIFDTNEIEKVDMDSNGNKMDTYLTVQKTLKKIEEIGTNENSTNNK